MSQFIDRLMFFKKYEERFSGGHGVVTNESRAWEDGYRQRWQHDKIVRSTHGTNCTGSCSWKIYVKNGLVTWETQQTDYPRTRPEMPNHEPRGCSRGASYSWYLYSGNRLKYPMIRGRLLKLWREARKTLAPVEAWASIVEDPDKARHYKSIRGMGGFVRSTWPEVNEIIARRQRLHGQDLWPGPRGRLLADPGHVDDLLCRRHALSVADRRHLPELLRLVLRSAAVLAADLRRADRRAGERGLVQRALSDPVGLERAADAHARRPLLYRGALQGRQERGGLARLQRGRQVLGSVAAPAGRHRRGARHGARPRHPQGVPRRAEGAVLRGLLPALHRHAVPGPARAAGRCLRARPVRARRRLRGRPRPGQQSRMEDGRLRRAQRPVRRPAGLDRLSLGRAGQVEHRAQERRRRRRDPAAALEHRASGRRAAGAVPVLRRARARIFQEHRPPADPDPQRAGPGDRARGRARLCGDGVRPDGRPLRHRPRPRRRRRDLLRRQTPYTPAWQEA